ARRRPARALQPSEASDEDDARRVLCRDTLAAYAKPRTLRSLADVGTSVVPYLAFSVLIYAAIGLSPLLALALSLPAAAVLLGACIGFRDWAHGSLLASRGANAWLGSGLGLLGLSPFVRWRHDHAVHHATSGDLDRRGVGDLPTLTIAEYRARPWRGRLGYRL